MKLTKTYLTIWFISVLLFALALGGFNYVIDPYKYYHQAPGTRVLTGFEREHKIWQVNIRQPKTVVMGNSRTLYGFDTGALEDERPFNYSFPGPSIEEVEKQLENLLYSTNAKTVYLVVDRICSIQETSSRETSALFNNDLEWLKAEFLRVKYLISMDTFKASINTLSKPIFYDDFGRRISFIFGKKSGNTLSERVKISEGYALKRGESDKECNTTAFERLLNKAYDSNINVSLILNPVHTRQKYIETQKNVHINSHINMKKVLVSTNALVAKEHNIEPFPIYDFNIINQYTTEPFDLVGNTEPNYWWESSHYKKALGDKIVDWLNAPENERDSTVGTSLTSQNIEQHIENQVQKLAKWQPLNPITVEKSIGIPK